MNNWAFFLGIDIGLQGVLQCHEESEEDDGFAGRLHWVEILGKFDLMHSVSFFVFVSILHLRYHVFIVLTLWYLWTLTSIIKIESLEALPAEAVQNPSEVSSTRRLPPQDLRWARNGGRVQGVGRPYHYCCQLRRLCLGSSGSTGRKCNRLEILISWVIPSCTFTYSILVKILKMPAIGCHATYLLT